MKAVIHKGTGKKANEFTFFLTGKNGKVVAKASEHYTRKSNLKKTLINYFSPCEIVDETIGTYK
jgi:uncharacterized protein YegP (UPF0339 family)